MKEIKFPINRIQTRLTVGSRLKSAREWLRHPYLLRTLFWCIAVSITLISIYLLNYKLQWVNPAAHTMAELCSLLISICIVYCLWIEYIVANQRKILLFTIAFSGLGLGHLVHMVMSLEPFGALYSKLIWQYYYGWYVAAACMIVIGILRDKPDDKQTARQAGIRKLIGSMIISIGFIALVLGVIWCWPRLNEIIPVPQALYAEPIKWLNNLYNIRIIVLAACSVAFVVSVGNHIRCEDSLGKGLTRCLLLVIAAQIAEMFSPADFSLAWWASHLYMSFGLMIFAVILGREFGKSYADSHSRIDHLEAVHYIWSRLSNTLDLRVVLLTFVSDTASMLSARFANIMLADDAGEHLTPVASFGLQDTPFHTKDPLPVTGGGRPGFYSGHASRSFREGQVCVVDDVFTDVEFVPWRLLAMYDGYAVSVPLTYHEVSLGVMNLFFESHVPLNDERIKLFQTLATAASVAIANAQLYDRSLESGSLSANKSFQQIIPKLAS